MAFFLTFLVPFDRLAPILERFQLSALSQETLALFEQFAAFFLLSSSDIPLLFLLCSNPFRAVCSFSAERAAGFCFANARAGCSVLQQVLVRFEMFAPVSQVISSLASCLYFLSDALVPFEVLFLYERSHTFSSNVVNCLVDAPCSHVLWSSSCRWLRFALVPFERFALFFQRL